ncbi:hypothetical protein LSAT2_020796 [Lamellibrachia satsuma]|nr:hypothetical protein LSAT2_020796 [Lamellibrachia satsuma]
MAQEEQNILLVESEIAHQRSSFALDIGASLAKVVYRSNKDYKEGKPIFTQGDPNVGRLRLVLLQRLEPEVLIQFIKDNCDRAEDASSPCCIPATGCGSSIYRRQLEQGLNIKIQQIPEWDAFAAGLHFLQKNDSLQSLCHETSVLGEADAMEKMTTVMKILTNIKQFSEIDATNIGQASPGKEEQPGSTSGSVPPPNPNSSVGADDQKETLENAPTCILTIIGSSIGWLQIDGTGSVKALDQSAMAGCTFVGLGRLLTRSSKTFLELIDLAKRGDPRKVDICTNDLKPDSDQGDVYSAMAADLSVSYFGQALIDPQGNFRDEDMLASLLSAICVDIVRITRLHALVSGQEKVYLAGNFVNDDHVRRIMTREIICGKLLSREQKMPDIRFLRHGGYLGVIGAMVADAKKPSN